jgi:4-amino-4-deoxy-L-arabinose transferase-like glycosyltransferase
MRKQDKYAYVGLFALIILGMIIGFLADSTIDPLYDDVTYIFYAHQMLAGNFNFDYSPFAISIGLIIPIAISFKLFGISNFPAVLPTIIYYISLVSLTFFTGKKLRGNSFGLLSAFFAATSPLATLYIYRVLPDLLLGLIVSLSFYLFLKAEERANKRIYFISGVVIGFGLFVRPDGLLLAFFYLISMLFNVKKGAKGNRLTPILYALSGILIIDSLYLFIFLFYTGDPLHPFLTFGGAVNALSTSPLWWNIRALSDMLNPVSLQNIMGPYTYTVGAAFLFALIGSALILAKRDKAEPIAIFFITVFFYYFLGTSSITHYSFIEVETRFFTSLLMPISIATAYLIFEVYENLKSELKIYAIISCAFLIFAVLFLYGNAYSSVLSYNKGNLEQEMLYNGVLASFENISKNATPTIYISSGGAGQLQANYMNFSSSYKVPAISIFIAYGLSGSCIYKNNSFLAVIGSASSLNNSIIEAKEWAGDNCTLIFIKNLSGGQFKALLYKIKEKLPP